MKSGDGNSEGMSEDKGEGKGEVRARARARARARGGLVVARSRVLAVASAARQQRWQY
jgi:hypothetical protein